MIEHILNKNMRDAFGKMHGYWEVYHSNGNPYIKGNYANGKRHGYWESYFSNGNLIYKGNYVHGLS